MLVWALTTHVAGLPPEQRDNAIITAAMAPGANAYVFAHYYGVGKRVAATSVLLATLLSVVTASIWLAVLS